MTTWSKAGSRPELVWPAESTSQATSPRCERGWSPDNIRGETAAKEELAEIAEDPALFLSRLVDREAKGTAHPAAGRIHR